MGTYIPVSLGYNLRVDDDTITESLQLMWVKSMVQKPTKKDDLTNFNWLIYIYSKFQSERCPTVSIYG